MIIKVAYPNTNKYCKEYFDVTEGEFRLGDIVVTDNEQDSMKYGVVIKVNVRTRKNTNKKQIKVASQLDRVYFWLDFEGKILHNKVKLSSNALSKYRETGTNLNLSDGDIINKMTRNMLLTHRPHRIIIAKNGNLLFHYGSLRINYARGTVFNINNKCDIPRGWKKDWDKHWYYSKILGVKL